MKVNWMHLKRKFRLFDRKGLDPDQIRTLQIFIYSVMGGVVFGNITTGIAMTSYMKDLGASDFVYGIVIALPPLANAFQFLISYWMEKTRKRTRLFIISGFIQRVSWLPFALVPVFIPMSQPQLRLWTAVILAVISACMGPAMNVSFYSILNDVVPLKIRGRYLATRSKISTFVGLIMGLIVGVLLDTLPPFTNYVAVFLIAFVFGTFDISCYLFCKLPELKTGKAPEGLFRMLGTVLTDKKYMRMVISLTCWFFSVQLCGPFFNVFSRSATGLAMSNMQIIVTGQVMYNLLLVFVVSRWGRALDEHGTKPVLVVAAFMTSFMPLIWVRMGPGMLWLVAISHAFSGATYCAVDLSQQNLFMVQAPEKNRSMYFAVYFIFTQLLGLALGSTTGGFLLDNVLSRVDNWGIVLGGVPFTRYNALFGLSFMLRLATVLGLLSGIQSDDAEGSTRNMIQAMLKAPANTYRALAYRIKRRRLRKQYDKEFDME